jgi:hypothetical protein
MLGLLACPGASFCVLGVKVRSEGAVPAGRTWALNSGAASLPTFTPGACCACYLTVLERSDWAKLTPLVVRGLEGMTRA